MEIDAKTKQLFVEAVGFRSIDATGPTVGLIIDTRLFESLSFAFIVGTFTGTGSVVLKLEHGDSDTLADAALVPADELIGAIAAPFTAATQINAVGYIGKKRYVRATIDAVESATLVVVTGVVAVQSNPQNAPVPAQ